MQRYLDGRTKDAVAIERLRSMEEAALRLHPNGYVVGFSGGKDSQCVAELAKEAGVKHELVYSNTTIDPPDVIYFIRKHYPHVAWRNPSESLLTALVRKGFPLRAKKWCCDYYKEDYGDGRIVVLGIRSEESRKRRNDRMVFQRCNQHKTKWLLHPILDWTCADVWDFIRERQLPYCKLYDEGWDRIGCLFCPNASPEEKRLCIERYPGWYAAFRRAFESLYADRLARRPHVVARWANAEAMFQWWLFESDNAPSDIGGLFDDDAGWCKCGNPSQRSGVTSPIDTHETCADCGKLLSE